MRVGSTSFCYDIYSLIKFWYRVRYFLSINFLCYQDSTINQYLPNSENLLIFNDLTIRLWKGTLEQILTLPLFYATFLCSTLSSLMILNLHPLNTFTSLWWVIQKEHFVNYAINPLLHAQETVLSQYQLAIFHELEENTTSLFLLLHWVCSFCS